MKAKLLFIPLITMALASCGPGSRGSSTDPQFDPEGNRIVKIWFHVSENDTSGEGRAYKARIEAFNAAYADRKIVAVAEFHPRNAQSAADYEDELIAKKQDHDLPDIITFDAPRVASYARRGIIYDITNQLTQAEREDFLSINSYGGRVYGLPIQESSAGFFYNKNLFRAAGVYDEVQNYTVSNPWTFEQFQSVCNRLKSVCSKVPAYMALKETKDEMAPFLLYSIIHAAGGEFVSSDGWTAEGYFNSTASKKGFQFIKDCLTSGYTDHNVTRDDFFTGKSALLLSSGWDLPDLEHGKYDIFKSYNDWGLLPYPKDVKACSATGSWSYAVTDNGITDKSAAYELIKWMASAESSNAITAATGMIPARISCNPNYQAGSPERLLLDQLINTGKERPITPGYPSFSDKFNDVIYGLKDGDVNSVVNNAASRLQDDLDLLRM